ncbi:B-cell receptor CD22 [Danio aesculapii]|uniref:B-cell receptor CD22 n=1 Tax=Danio aesculapii TaxID=1142201 RepID=UPI0024BF846A|nr:B-cell receptor CD22 [Danio aesculapii]
MFCVFALIFLLVIPGICSQKWHVQYSKMAICALKGSTVQLSGSYKHPDGLTVTEIFWTVNPKRGEAINLLDNPDYTGRVEFFHKENFFFLKLSNVRHEDEGQYCIRIETKVEIEQYLGYPGTELTVTDLRVETPEEAVEGESPVLTCKSSCNLSSTNFSWYRNGESFPESERQNQLILKSVSRGDAGNYSCAVRDLNHLPSPALTLNIRYPPKSVSVSVSGSAVIVSGDSVTLSCSSDSNPPAVNFSWFKENQSSAVGSGQSFSISSFNSSHSGRYYCEAENKYGSQRSASVSLTATDGQNTLLYAAAVGLGAAFICICTIIVALKIIRRKTEDAEVQGDLSKQENKSTSVMDQMNSCNPDPDVCQKKPKEHQTAGDEDDVQYASVYHVRNADKTTVEAESQYGNVSNRRSDDSSVIYSSIGVS